MNTVETRIQKILNRGFDVPSVFKSVLRKESAFTHDEEILDLIFLEREYFNESENLLNAFSKAKLIVATSHALILVEEGMNEMDTDCLGFKIKQIMYGKISSIELEKCLLKGILKICTDASSNAETLVEFNTCKYEQFFENFIVIIRKKVVDYITRR